MRRQVDLRSDRRIYSTTGELTRQQVNLLPTVGDRQTYSATGRPTRQQADTQSTLLMKVDIVDESRHCFLKVDIVDESQNC